MRRDRHIYDTEQLRKLSAAHKVICDMRGVDPVGRDGREIASRLLDTCTGSEPEGDLLKAFTH